MIGRYSQAMSMQPPKKPRKTRYDKGSVKANDRDIFALTWIAQQYAMRFDHACQLISMHPGPGVGPEGLSWSAARQVVNRWRKAGWIGYQQMLAGEPAWLWLTREGLAAYGLTQFKAAPPAISRLRHLHAVNEVRLACYEQDEDDTDEWISERMIHAGMFTLPQTPETRHIPDGILKRDNGGIYAIEVELRQKKPADIYKKMHALLNTWDNDAMTYFYTGIWYYTPDPGIQKALEIARDAHSKHSQRTSLIEIGPVPSFEISE